LFVNDAEQVYDKLENAGYTIISKGLVDFKNYKAFIVRDPDGHAMLIEGSADKYLSK
jgi:hypothetical protein